MATNTWLSRALARAQVDTLTPGGTIEVGDLFKVTINGKTVTYAATGTTVASVVTGLVAALGAIDEPEFTEITFTDSTTAVTCTGVTAGVPFTITVETTESNGGAADAQTFVQATTTAATGPNHANDINNWSLGAAPVNTNDVDIDLDRGAILYGIDALSAVTLASLDVYSAGQTDGTIGLPQVNASGYYEYRPRYLQVGATLCRINTQSERVMLDFGAVQTACEVRATGSATDDIPAVLLKGTHTSNVFEFKSGTSGLGFHLGEDVAAATVRVSPEASLVIGEVASTLTAVTSHGNTLIQTAATTVTVEDGETKIIGTGAYTTLNVDGGLCKYESSGTVSTANITGTVDCSGDISPRIFSVTNLEPGGLIIDPNQTITHSAGIARSARVRQVTAA
jgi:hypothetical protein